MIPKTWASGAGMHAAPLVSEPFRAQLPKAIKVPVFGQQSIDSVFAAERCDLGVEHQIPNCVPLSDAFGEELRIAGGGAQDHCARRSKRPSPRLRCFVSRVRRVEEPGVGQDTEEFTRAEHREGLASRRLGKCCRTGAVGPVQWHFRPVGVHENIGVDGDQSRPSIIS